MNSFEEIVKQEKATLYVQRDRELFSFYTLSLIAQEQASKKLKRKLCASLILFTVCLCLFFSPISQIMGYFIAHLRTINMFDIFNMALISYGVTGFFIVLIKMRVIVFR
jgi:hypothetical protein